MRTVCLGLCSLVILAAGCRQESTPATKAEEIRGEPIASAVVRPATIPAPSNATLPVVAGNTPSTGAVDPAFPLVGFDKLSGYTIEISDELLGPVTNDVAAITAKTEALIPLAVKAFNEKRAAIRGFMLPLKVEGGLVLELLIMKDQSMCCYGSTPKIHEWVSVKMTGKGVKPLMDQPVTLFGKLRIGEMRENGYLVGIYQMDGERMEAPEE